MSQLGALLVTMFLSRPTWLSTIRQYLNVKTPPPLWNEQGMFRWWLQSLTRHALSSIGVEVAPEALLIAFAEDAAPSPIRIEQGPELLAPDDLARVEEEAQFAVADHPEASVLITDARQAAAHRRGVLEDCRRSAINRALAAAAPDEQRTYFVGYRGKVNGFRVYPVVSVITSRWADYPALTREQMNSRIFTRRSLQEALVSKILESATDQLWHQAPPNGFKLDAELREDLIRHAARDFVSRLAFVHGEWDGLTFDAAMDAVSALPYEGRTGVGTIVLVKADHPDVDVAVAFREPVSLQNTRAFRKALEMSGTDLHLLSDGVTAYGLGLVAPTYDVQSESLYTVKVVGRGSWELAHVDMPLLRSDYGIIRLPKERISEGFFVDTVERVFADDVEAHKLWNLTLAATEQQHGTMLVVHKDAAGEALRLAPQALAIEPRYLEAATLRSLTSIDGAVLVSPDGRCHAIGVILDGTAIPGAGDPARGARYNSAVRYHSAAEPGTCVIVIVSEDGMINLLPELRRRVRRNDVETAVQQLEDAVYAEIANFELIGTADRRVESLKFYFDHAQCDRVNAAREKTNEIRKATSGFHLVEVEQIRPHPDLTDEYFLPEPA